MIEPGSSLPQKKQDEKPSATGLDEIDLEILALLQQDASWSSGDIGEAVGLSQSPCSRRINRLKEGGYISRIVAIVDRDKLSLGVQMFVQIKLARHDLAGLEEFKKAIAAFPEVLECHFILGGFDFLLRIVARDIAAYEEFKCGKLSQVANVRELNSFLAASVIKSTTELPLGR